MIGKKFKGRKFFVFKNEKNVEKEIDKIFQKNVKNLGNCVTIFSKKLSLEVFKCKNKIDRTLSKLNITENRKRT